MNKLLHDKKRIIVVIFDVLLLVLAFFLKDIASAMRTLFPSCFFLERGYLCHACGGTRCVGAFFSGRFDIAFAYNQFVFFLILYAFVALIFLNIYCLFDSMPGKRIFRVMIGYRAVIILMVSFVVFGVIRHFVVM